MNWLGFHYLFNGFHLDVVFSDVGVRCSIQEVTSFLRFFKTPENSFKP
jgi:hypothetical protein